MSQTLLVECVSRWAIWMNLNVSVFALSVSQYLVITIAHQPKGLLIWLAVFNIALFYQVYLWMIGDQLFPMKYCSFLHQYSCMSWYITKILFRVAFNIQNLKIYQINYCVHTHLYQYRCWCYMVHIYIYIYILYL